jgi:hypothetical protein
VERLDGGRVDDKILQFRSRTARPRRYKGANQNHLLKWNPSPFMPYSISTSRLRGWTPLALCHLILVLLHLSMVATAHAAQQTLGLPQPVSKPYLVAMNPPGLRFREAASLAPLVRKPVATGSPVAATSPELSEVALANDHAAASTPPMPIAPPSEQIATTGSTPAKTEPTTPTSKAQPILPDDTRRKVQSQDFLPLFRFPGASGSNEDVTVPVPPTPGTLPPSSATYRQE